MPSRKRDGKRKSRSEFANSRVPELGYYVIFTDTEKTEKNYLDGLKRNLPSKLRGRLVIKVFPRVKTKGLAEACSLPGRTHASRFGSRGISGT
ncbi:MAG: hypothetical protein WAY93_11010 [Atopobiaceae bacterium]|jgi:hypothetical protein|nr:RloB family protein [Atopobiaceae bacterium]